MISKRISTIAKNLKNTDLIADVGCDHGYLIIEAFKNYNIKKAYAIDNKELPLENAINNIKKTNYYQDVTFLLSNGLEKLEDKVDAIIFAGMGGLLIIELLEKDFDKVKDAKLIIQANRNTYDVRKFLSERFYKVANEEVVYEDNKYYEVIVFEKNNNIINYSYNELYFGPILLKEKTEVFINKLNNDLRILNNIAFKSEETIDKINKIKEILW